MNVDQLIVSGTLAALVASGTPIGTVAAQTVGTQGIWENDRIQVRRISLAPGETLTGESARELWETTDSFEQRPSPDQDAMSLMDRQTSKAA